MKRIETIITFQIHPTLTNKKFILQGVKPDFEPSQKPPVLLSQDLGMNFLHPSTFWNEIQASLV